MKPTVNIRLDKRRIQKTGEHAGKYHIKVFVTFRVVKDGVLAWDQQPYITNQFATQEEFGAAFAQRKPKRADLLLIREKVQADAQRAKDIIDKYEIESQKRFDLHFLPGKNITTAAGQFQYKIDNLLYSTDKTTGARVLKTNPQISSAEKYQTALNSLIEYGGAHLTFNEITPEWLQGYQDWYTRPREIGKNGNKSVKTPSITSVGINLRHLRHIFNQAIKMHVIPAKLYPFGMGEDKFTIPEGGKEVKDFLVPTEKDRLIQFNPNREDISEGYDYGLFCYYSNGINMADIAALRFSKMEKEYFLVEREKTRGKLKKIKRIVVPIRQEHLDIIKRRGNKTLDPNGYVFPILNDQMGPKEKFAAVRKFVKRTNNALRQIQKELGFDTKLTTYTLRHTFSFMIMHQGGSTEILQDSLGHGSAKTTEAYKHGFMLDTKKKFAEGL